MANQGVTIINHSVGWIWTGPGDGTWHVGYQQQPALDGRRGGQTWRPVGERRRERSPVRLVRDLSGSRFRRRARVQPEILGSQKPAYPSLESQLSDLVERALEAPETAPSLAEEAPLSEDGAVAVTIQFAGDPDVVVAYLASLEILPANVSDDRIEAYVPLLELPDLVARDDVERIELIHPPTPRPGQPRPRPQSMS